jgi:uncharacterized protein (DUF2164 family)
MTVGPKGRFIGYVRGPAQHRGETMSIRLQKDTEKYLLGSIKRFVADNLDTEMREIGPSIYNQAIADAQSYIQDKVADLGGTRYEAEFDFWKK